MKVNKQTNKLACKNILSSSPNPTIVLAELTRLSEVGVWRGEYIPVYNKFTEYSSGK
jgi:hypothetical protein